MSGPSRIVFGLVVPPAGSRLSAGVDRLMTALGERVGCGVERRDADSYAALAGDIREARADVAWLPPIVVVRLAEHVTPLATIVRGRGTAYEAALVVRGSSKIRSVDALRGTRAGWVDRWSAAGFVLPRVNLAVLGLDPRTLFRTETFHGSHQATIRALLDGACDVAGSYARADAAGEVSTGAWSEIDGADVRVIATFGAIPPDVVAARRSLDPATASAFLAAAKSVCAEEPALMHDVFGGDELEDGLAGGYAALERALEMATARGIFGDE